MKIVNGILMSALLSFNLIYAQCTDNFSLGNDTSICQNESFNLVLSNIYDNYFWQNTSTNNSYQVNGPGTYYCITELASTNNLVVNGDFEQGNTLFTTDYTYYPIADINGPQGSYGVINNSNTWFNPFNPCTDHTSGFGQMMVVDGSASNGGNDAIWCQSIPVQAGSSYRFSYWVQSVVVSPVLANIQVRINGVAVDAELAPAGTCAWEEREIDWTSPITGNVDFCLYDLELAGNGNDFALDDISLVEVCQYTDTIVVTASPPDTMLTRLEICPGDSVFLEGAWQSTAGLYYNPVVGSACNDVIETNLTVTVTDTVNVQLDICPGDSVFLEGGWRDTPGLYFDYQTSVPCDDVLATELVWLPLDTITDTVEICQGDSAFLQGQWQLSSGPYYDLVPGTVCNDYLETTLTVNSLPLADAGPDQTVSFEQVVTLTAEDAGNNASYLWSSSNNFNDTNQSIDVEVVALLESYILQVMANGCENFDTVTINGLPLNLAIRVPNAFSPNLDGKNDVFRLVNSDEFNGVKLKIYNRWGELIFIEESVNPMWDGTNSQGMSCPLDTYMFYIEAEPYGGLDKMRRSGNLTLIR